MIMRIEFNWKLIFESMKFYLIEELKRRAPTHDGDLKRSITAAIEDDRLIISALHYALYVDKGTRPHMPPVDALEKWAKDKLGDPDLKWALAYHIKKYGTKPSWFIRDTIEQELPRILKDALQVPGAIEVN